MGTESSGFSSKLWFGVGNKGSLVVCIFGTCITSCPRPVDLIFVTVPIYNEISSLQNQIHKKTIQNQPDEYFLQKLKQNLCFCLCKAGLLPLSLNLCINWINYVVRCFLNDQPLIHCHCTINSSISLRMTNRNAVAPFHCRNFHLHSVFFLAF